MCGNDSDNSPPFPENMGHPITADGVDRKLFYLGVKKNLQQVFGRDCLWALLPVCSRYRVAMQGPRLVPRLSSSLSSLAVQKKCCK